MERKDFLRNSLGIIGAGSLAIACGKSATGTVNNGTGTSTGGTTTGSSSCVVSPTEVEGPYPYPGGEITNPLQRVDITGGQTGVPLNMTLAVVNANNACAAVSGARVDIWYCNKDGYYSGYGNQPGLLGTQSYLGQTWLRGYQLSDSNGQVKFTGIYPGWYSGRATHIHVEVFVNNVLVKTTQMAFPETISDTVHNSSLYAAHGINTTRNTADGIFGNSATDLANQTMTLTGDTTNGYTGTYKIGISI